MVWNGNLVCTVRSAAITMRPIAEICYARAACLESTILLIVGRMGITLEKLEVEAIANVDVRGMLVVERHVPVGFQSMQCKVDIRATDAASKEELQKLM